MTFLSEISMSPQEAREREWERLYALLRGVLSHGGRESPFGEGDFWLVDDDWGGHLQKVCVFRIGFITKRLVSDVQVLLDSQFPDWGVMFQLEIKDISENIPPEGLIVYADSVDEAWDAEQLARVFGKAFAFRSS